MLQFLRLGLFVCVGLLVSACGPQLLPLADVQQLQAKDGSYGQDIYGVRRAAGEVVPNMMGNQVVQIRTFTAKTNDFGNEVADTEIAGAECEVQAEDAVAQIRTPGALHVPLYGYRSPDMTVRCARAGYSDAVTVINKFNLTQAERSRAVSSAAASGGLIGALVGAAINVAIAAANDPTDDVFNYVPPTLLFRPGTSSLTDPDAPQQETPVVQSAAAQPAAGQQSATAIQPSAENADSTETRTVSEPIDQKTRPLVAKAPGDDPVNAAVQTGPQTPASNDGLWDVSGSGQPGVNENSSDWEKKCKPFCT